jgi:hypothetical protein
MSSGWLTNIFADLPGCNDSLFNYLWADKRLRFAYNQHLSDVIDELSARLVCAALTRRASLFISLPDYQPHRSAFLFTTALIRHTYNSRSLDVGSQVILYCGSTVGIREQLGQTSIGGMSLDLASAFRQQNISKRDSPLKDIKRKANQTYAVKIIKKDLGWTLGRTQKGDIIAISQLPKVVTAYAPSDPSAILDRHKPQWIAVDIDESHKAVWLQPMLEEAARRQIPVIAWGVNPLSECTATFKRYAQVFVWEPYIRRKEGAVGNEMSTLSSTAATQLQPYVLEGSNVDQLADTLRSANQLLASGARNVSGIFGKDALRQHWAYLRALEALHVPYDFYEAEVTRLWGIKTFSQLQAGCERFRDACYQSYPQLALELEKVFVMCEQAADLIREGESPLWSALCNLCIDEPISDEARLIVFSGQGRKQLFQLALLAYHNICDSDLQDVRTWLLTLDELRRLVRQSSTHTQSRDEAELRIVDESLDWRPLLVGLPSPQLTPKILPALLHNSLDIIVYPHQISALKHRTDEWGKAISHDSVRLSQILNQIGGKSIQQAASRSSSRLKFSNPMNLNANTAERKARARVEQLWQPDDPVAEVARLLQIDESTFDDAPLFHESKSAGQVDEQEIWCDKVVKVRFDNGASITFPFDEMINVVKSGHSKPDERYVGSLQCGDRVILIHGQRRQSFYELIISRVHQHPSMMLNLALIERWRNDFANAYELWRKRGSQNLDELLKCLRDKGSRLMSTAALRSWLQGQILCPQDEEDLRRLADVLDMDYVRQHYKRIGRAACRLRSLHRVLSSKLNRWLDQQASEIDAGSDADVIDQELGLTFGDLRSSLLLLHVKDVENIQGLFLRSSLGRLED